MARHIKTEVIEMPWQKDLHELDGDILRKEARRRLEASASGAERECSDLARDVDGVKTGDLWKKLAPTWSAFCFEYFGRPAEFVDSVTAGVKILRGQGHDGPITSMQAQTAVDLARKQADPESGEYVKRGRPMKDEENPSNTRNNGSVDKPGILRRLARSRPDLLDRIEAGELTANAAAIEAGFRRPMKSIPIDSPDAAIRALLKAFSVDDLAMALGRAADQSGLLD